MELLLAYAGQEIDINNISGIDVAMNAASANVICLVFFLSNILLADYMIYRDLVCLYYDEVFGESTFIY